MNYQKMRRFHDVKIFLRISFLFAFLAVYHIFSFKIFRLKMSLETFTDFCEIILIRVSYWNGKIHQRFEDFFGLHTFLADNLDHPLTLKNIYDYAFVFEQVFVPSQFRFVESEFRKIRSDLKTGNFKLRTQTLNFTYSSMNVGFCIGSVKKEIQMIKEIYEKFLGVFLLSYFVLREN